MNILDQRIDEIKENCKNMWDVVDLMDCAEFTTPNLLAALKLAVSQRNIWVGGFSTDPKNHIATYDTALLTLLSPKRKKDL